ncbi:DUF3055 domain-containing protein [Sulfoacidibacillus thermotolerans]|uniref:DUF3055 domain-containing protein n=1 Tax=Sulfoacidibacillus thermotolerans TaxID=1765684 RepID=A0A2U3D8X5_SULT2|nr:DUF3055 domain-containing protein [Sulfoacidibacillus thermotolerans]PWI57732.1 hypothetical protein BM613_07025 [Sulfoacidibacillus thermotolerans]
MENLDLLYDETEQCPVRYVGFIGLHSHFDLAIVSTSHFYAKKMVISTQTGKMALLSAQEAEDVAYLSSVFAITADEAEELSAFLCANL